MQRLQTLCCNIRPRLWHEVMIVCIQIGLPLPILIADLVLTLNAVSFDTLFIEVELFGFVIPLVLVNILFDLICIVMVVDWVCKL